MVINIRKVVVILLIVYSSTQVQPTAEICLTHSQTKFSNVDNNITREWLLSLACESAFAQYMSDKSLEVHCTVLYLNHTNFLTKFECNSTFCI